MLPVTAIFHLDRRITDVISTSTGINWLRSLLSEHGDLSFLLCFAKQCLVVRESFKTISSVTDFSGITLNNYTLMRPRFKRRERT